MGRWLLHGHTHDTIRQRGKSIHVGLDAWKLTPVAIDTIARIVQKFPPDDDVGTAPPCTAVSPH